MLGVLVYCTVFALLWAGGLVWVLERKEKKYLLGGLSFTDAFLAGSFFLIVVYVSNIVVILRWPRFAFFYDIALVTGLAGFGLYRETGYKARAALHSRRLRAEVRLLEHHVSRDPSNAAYLERLSELYEALGDPKQALEAARLAARLEPTVRNSWRVKHLEER